MVGAVELIVIVAVAAAPLIVTDDGTLQVGRSIAPAGLDVRLHFRFTAPRKPPAGVTVMVDVLPVVAPALSVTAAPSRLKLPAGLLELTVRLIGPLSVVEPLVPVTVTMYAPAVVVAVVLTVRVEVLKSRPSSATDVGLRLQVGLLVAPDGLDVMAHVKATVAVNPPVGKIAAVVVFPVATPATTLSAAPVMLKEGISTLTVALPLLVE